MIDPYRMVFINVLSLILLASLFFFYLFIYPKKRINPLLIVVLISILPLISLLRTGSYESGDFTIHVYRSIEFYESFKEGNLLPSWAGDLNAKFGYPLFIFLNPLPYYLSSLFHLMGAQYITSLKILIAFSFISSGVFFYLWAKEETGNKFSALAGAIVYLFTPYHLVDLHFRVAVGEIVFFAFLPLFFYCIFKFSKLKNLFWLIASSISFSLLVLSHQAMALFSTILIIPYLIYLAKQSKFPFKNFSALLFPIMIGFIHSIYAWLPHLIFPRYTLAYQLANETVSFPSFQELLFSTWMFGFLFQGQKGELSYMIGYTQIFILLGAFLYSLKKFNNKIRLKILLWVFISFFIIFMMTPFSSFIWDHASILNTAQFSTRLLVLLTFSISATMVYLATIKKKFLIKLILIVTIGYTILNWGHRRIIPEISDMTLVNNLPHSTSQGEGFCCMGQPRWTKSEKRWMDKIPEENLEIISGKAEIKDMKRSSVHHEYITYSEDYIKVKENTWFFPGWKLTIDGKASTFIYNDKQNPGLFIFSIPPGLHKIELEYNDLPQLLFAKLISVFTLLLSLLILAISFLRNSKINFPPKVLNKFLRFFPRFDF